MESHLEGKRVGSSRPSFRRRLATAVMAVTPLFGLVLGIGGPTVARADSQPWIVVNDVTMPRPTSGTTTFGFTISLIHAINATASVNYATADGTARSTFDYVPTSGTATFTPGKTTQTVNVTVNGSTLHTGDRYFYLNISGAVHAVVQHNGQGTIVDTSMLPYVNVNDATVTQGSGAPGSAVFNVTLTSPSANKVKVHYVTGNGSAIAGTDFTQLSGVLTFPAAATTEQVTVPVTGFGIYQAMKYFYLYISQPVNAAMGKSSALGTILNNNHIAYITTDDVTIAEPGSGTAIVNVPIRIVPVSNFAVTLAYTTGNGSAVAGTDYTSAAGTVTIPALTAQVTVPVTVNASGLSSSRYFIFYVNTPSAGATVLRGNSFVTITAGAYNQLTVADVGVLAPTSGTTTVTFTVSLSPSSGGTVGVNYTTADGSATAGTHYVAASGTLSFTAGQTSKTVTVTVKADQAQFTDVYFNLNLSTPTGGAVIERSQGYGEILNNSIQPVISAASPVITKPGSGTVAEPFVITLSAASLNTVTVNYATSNGSAIAGSDYSAANGTATFAPGITTQTVNVNVNGTTTAGGDIYYYLYLSAPVNAQIASSPIVGYIQNPNHNPTLSINTIAFYKPSSKTAIAKLTATLSSASLNTVTANYATSNGNAIAGSDYSAASGVVTFTPGTTTQSISITITGNTLPTADRYFYVNLSAPSNATLVTSQGLVDIIDSRMVPYVSVGATSIQKPSSGSANAVFTVTLSPASPNTVTVNYATSDGSAVAGQDYTAATGTVTFLPGISSQTVNVPVTASTFHTGDRYFYLYLNTPVNALMGTNPNIAWIIDPTFNPDLTIDDTGILKPTSGTTVEHLTVHLYPSSPNTVTVNYATSDGSAVAGVDYVASNGTLTFTPGTTSQVVSVTVNGSASSVPDRYFAVNLSSPLHAQFAGRSTAYGQIIDQVAPINGTSYLTVQDAAVLKPDSGTATDTFNVSLFPSAAGPVTVNYATGDGNAIAGAGDYVSVRGTLTFNPGQTTKSVSVTINGNTMSTVDKYFTFNMGSPTGTSTMFRGSSYGLILNNQPDNRLSVGPDITINRGTSGSQIVNFSVSLSAPQQFPVQVDYTTNDGTAVAPDGYTPDSGTLVFSPGQTTQTVGITVPGNPVYIGTQYFFFDLSNPINSTIAAGRETAYIYNLDTFAITGKAIDQTGAGLAGATITRTGNNQPASAVTTAGDGSFSILNTVDGDYTVTATLAGEAFVPANMVVTVRGAAAVAGPFLGYAGTGITGLVTDFSGKALAGVTVTRTGGGASTVAVTTDTLGYYAFGNVAAGTAYVVTPTKASFTFNPSSYTFNVAATTVANQDFVGLQGVFISGRVTTIGGVGVSGVTITRTGSGPTVTVKTNSQGYYGFSNVPATVGGITYTITPTKTGKTFSPTNAPATVTTTTNATGINFTQN